MVWLGLFVTLLGFLLSVASLALAASVAARLILVLLGIGVSLAGILGVLNPVFVKKAIWRQQVR